MRLLLQGRPLSVILAIITAAIGVISLAAGLEGWLTTRLVLWERVLLIVGGLLLITPGIYTDLAGALCLFLPVANQLKQRARP